MIPLVVDASVAAAVAIGGQRTAAVGALLERWDQYAPVAPYVYALETPWLLLKRERNTRASGFAMSALEQLRALQVHIAEAPSQEQLDLALAFALDRNMGIYDAMYVLLARQIAAPIASRDRRLLDVAGACGVDVLDVR